MASDRRRLAEAAEGMGRPAQREAGCARAQGSTRRPALVICITHVVQYKFHFALLMWVFVFACLSREMVSRNCPRRCITAHWWH